MDLTSIIGIIMIIAVLAAAVIQGGAQIFAALVQRGGKKKESAIDETGRWKLAIDPKTSSIEERVIATFSEASMAKGKNTKVTIIQESDFDAKK